MHTPLEYARLVDEARREARRLRREALREWGSAMAAWLRSALHRPSRRHVEV